MLNDRVKKISSNNFFQAIINREHNELQFLLVLSVSVAEKISMSGSPNTGS